MFSILILGLLVIIAVSLVRNSHAHRMKVALRQERAEAVRAERLAQEVQISEGVSTVRQMSRDKIVRDGGESYGNYARRVHRSHARV